jgi:hypothetical protein
LIVAWNDFFETDCRRSRLCCHWSRHAESELHVPVHGYGWIDFLQHMAGSYLQRVGSGSDDSSSQTYIRSTDDSMG